MKCPGCAAYQHFDSAPGVTRCWSCGLKTDYGALKSPEEQILIFIRSLFRARHAGAAPLQRPLSFLVTVFGWCMYPLTGVSRMKVAGLWVMVVLFGVPFLVKAGLMMLDGLRYLKTILNW